MGYILYFFLIISTIIFKRNFLKNVNIHRKNKIPLLIFFVWIYGVILGVIRGNQLSLLIQNFAGMVLYILFYIMQINKIKVEKIKKLLYNGSLFSMWFTFIAYLLYYNGFSSFIRICPLFKNYSSGGTNILYSNQLTIFIIISISLFNLLKRKDFVKNGIYFFISSIDVIFFIQLSGFLLAYIAVIVITIVAWVYTYLKLSKINLYLLIIGTCILVIFVFYSYFFGGIIYEIFSTEDLGNMIRYEQIQLALKEANLFGNGLGATFQTFLRTDPSQGYAMEVTYVNLIHKFGWILAIFLIYTYIVNFKIFFSNLLSKFRIQNSLIAISSIAFIFPSLSNPFLYSIIAVTLHVCSLYILIGDRIDEKNNDYI